MSYATVLAALHERLAEVPGIGALIVGEPLTAQVSPLMYSMLRSFTRESQGTIVKIIYRTRHRLCVRYENPPEAEEVLIGFVNTIPAAICAPHKWGRIPGGDMTITVGEAGFVTIGGIEYRSLDFTSEVIEFAALGGSI